VLAAVDVLGALCSWAEHSACRTSSACTLPDDSPEMASRDTAWSGLALLMDPAAAAALHLQGGCCMTSETTAMCMDLLPDQCVLGTFYKDKPCREITDCVVKPPRARRLLLARTEEVYRQRHRAALRHRLWECFTRTSSALTCLVAPSPPSPSTPPPGPILGACCYRQTGRMSRERSCKQLPCSCSVGCWGDL